MKKNTKTPLWQTIFMGVGIVSAAGLIFNLFIISRPAKKDLVTELPISVHDKTLLFTLSNLLNTPIEHEGELEMLNNGDEFYPALFSDIASARQSIHFSAYIWEPGIVSDQLFALLIAKAHEGVDVRLVLDGFGGLKVPKKDIEALRSAGAEVEIYHPLGFQRFTKLHKRNHTRSIIIDETVGYTGGMAVADYWLGDAEDSSHWRDIMFRIRGGMLRHVERSFAALWEVARGEVLAPTAETDGGALPESTMESISLTSFSLDEDVQQLSTFFALSISAAQETTFIATPYMVLEKQVEKAIIDAAHRGVEVRILLPGPVIDSKIVQTASQYYYTRLLEAGVKIYEYAPTMMHTKALVVDNGWSIIGSANIDTRSSFFNVENVIGIQNEQFAGALTEVLEQDLEKSKEITLSEWDDRSIFRKVFEPLVYIFDKQL